MTARKPSAAQLRVLDNLIAGRTADHGLVGQSARGGHWKVLRALVGREWIAGSFIRDEWSATPAGREAARHGAR